MNKETSLERLTSSSFTSLGSLLKAELTRVILENYSNKKAALLYKLMGDNEEFWDIIGKGIVNRESKKLY